MKKSLIALAALGAFAGAASAQSSVTLYGLIDLQYNYIKSGDASLSKGDSINRLADANDMGGPGSRWGLRVAEDLGSGLKANVVLESGFTGDNGASAQPLANGGTRLFGRQAFVSLASASLGEVRLGRQYTLHDEVQSLNNPGGNTTFMNPGANGGYSTTGSLAAMGGRVPLFIDAVRQDNAVQYISPSFAGFRVQAMVAAGEGTADRYQGVKGSYANGPLNVALAYEQSKSFLGRAAGAGVGAIAAGGTTNKIVSLGANYDFGMVKVFGGYQQGKDLAPGVGIAGTLVVPAANGLAGITSTKLNAYTLGAAMPFGAATVSVNYTRAKHENDLGADRTVGRIGVGANYALSKLTSVYAVATVANGDLKDVVLEKQVFQLGLRKAF